MRVDGGRLQQLAGGVHHRHLAAGAYAGVEPHHCLGASRCGEQQLVQIAAENLDGFGFGRLAQLQHQLAADVQLRLHPPGPAADFHQPLVGGPVAVFDSTMRGDHALARVRRQRVEFHAQAQRRRQHAQSATAKNRQRTMRRNGAIGFTIGIVVAEFFFLGHFLAGHHGSAEKALFLHACAQLGEQLRRLGKTLGEDVARAFESRFGIGHVDRLDGGGGGLHVEIFRRFKLRIERGVGKQRVGQRLQSGFARDLRLGAALGLKRQIDIFQRLLGNGPVYRSLQRIGEFALLADRSNYRVAALLHLTQIQQAFFEIA